MRINFKKLKALAVNTVSGVMLGHVHDAIIDSEAHVIIQYEVHSPLLRRQTYLINREQVVSITADAMVVDDSIAEAGKNPQRPDRVSVAPKPIVMRKNQS